MAGSRHYFIEHPTRGILTQTGIDADDGKPHWSHTQSRTVARTFTTLAQARTALKTLDANCEAGAYIMERVFAGEFRYEPDPEGVSPMNVTITINAELARAQGKFVSRDDLREAILEEISEPGTLYVDESTYEVISWDVS